MILRDRTTCQVDAAPAGLRDAVAALMRTSRAPGLSLAVVSRDRLLLAAGFGRAAVDRAGAATPATSYLWFSMSKIVTATAALRLADDGLLDLDAPVGTYLEDVRAPGPRRPTVRQLLTHTAGLGNPLPVRWVHPAAADPPDPDVMLRRLLARRRAFRYPVDREARYSNVGYLAAGQVVSRVAGVPFETYVRDAVLGPAGMARTGFAHRADAEVATGHVRVPRAADPLLRRLLPAGVAGARCDGYLTLDPFHVDGPAYGGIVGDVLDAARFLRLHLRDGEIDGTRVLTARTARVMREVTRPGRPFDHGIGWFRPRDAGEVDWVQHLGAGAGFWNVMRLYPERDLGIVLMTNGTARCDVEPLFALLAGASWS